MGLTPSFTSINGRGKPIVIVEKANDAWASTGTVTFSATTAQEALGATKAISSSSAANNRITTSVAHGLLEGMRVRIAGHSGSTPDINGDWEVVDVWSTTEFEIGVDITVGGTGGTVRQIPDYRYVKVGMRALANKTTTGANRIVWGRITAVDTVNFIITVDKWRMGNLTTTPDTGGVTVNGYVVLLPFCYELRETLSPDMLVHPLLRTYLLPNRTAVKFFGWKYRATLDYSRHIQADAIINMRQALNLKETDKLILIPREDKSGYAYNVYHAEDVNISRFGYGPGHKNVVFSFAGKETISSWPLPESGYGFGYGQRYGTQL